MYNNKIIKKYTHAFTLVELIVVIVILAILATIAFLSFSNQSSSARDSTRMSDQTNIAKGAALMQTVSGKYPIPDSGIPIYDSGTLVGTQGYAATKVLGMIKISSGGGKDPLDGSYYTYTTNVTQTKYQLVAFLENAQSLAMDMYPFDSVLSAFAVTYTNRYPFSKGDSIGALFKTSSSGTTINTYIPIQDTSTGIELRDTTTNTGITGIISNTTPVVASTELAGLAGVLLPSRYPGCDMDDISLGNGQRWSLCNVGASKAYNGETVLTYSGMHQNYLNTNLLYTLGNFYQWGRNDNITQGPTLSGAVIQSSDLNNGYLGNNAFIIQHYLSSPPYPIRDWITPSNDNLWGGAGSDISSGTFLSMGSPASMEGPCAIGYHVPTINEWVDGLKSIAPQLMTGSGSGNANWAYKDIVINKLKIPLTGFRRDLDGWYNWPGEISTFWSSSRGQVIWINSYASGLTIGSDDPANNYLPAYGYAVRCVKN